MAGGGPAWRVGRARVSRAGPAWGVSRARVGRARVGRARVSRAGRGRAGCGLWSVAGRLVWGHQCWPQGIIVGQSRAGGAEQRCSGGLGLWALKLEVVEVYGGQSRHQGAVPPTQTPGEALSMQSGQVPLGHWGPLGVLRVTGVLWGVLRVIWGPLGILWGRPGCLGSSGAFWDHLASSGVVRPLAAAPPVLSLPRVGTGCLPPRPPEGTQSPKSGGMEEGSPRSAGEQSCRHPV